MADDLSLLDYPIGIFPLAYFLVFFVLYIILFWGNKNKDAEEIKYKLSVIEAKLDLFITNQDCLNCQHTLRYPSTFSGQVQCPKCSTIVDIHSQ